MNSTTLTIDNSSLSTYLHVYSKAAYQNYWQPIPALDIRPELTGKSKPYSLTIMFINSCRLFYKESSQDPIFPADLQDFDGLWVNRDSRARPLACIDWIEACPYQGACQDSYRTNQDNDKDFVFTRHALNQSSSFHAIEFRGATGLDAQYRIEDYVSLPLARDPPQWIVESWNLFNASLARIQYDALDIVTG